MARGVVFRPQAEDEVLDVRQWYEAKRPGLGQEFGQALDVLVARIAESPLAFPRVHSESRRAVLSRFPYAVYFRVADEAVVVSRFRSPSNLEGASRCLTETCATSFAPQILDGCNVRSLVARELQIPLDAVPGRTSAKGRACLTNGDG